jgi:pimeloyl-ACP methyl ester carboxylesterase
MLHAAFTIVALNYLPLARTLCQTFLAHHPESRFFVLMADRPGADFGGTFAALYEHACPRVARGAVPDAFYRVPPAPSAVLVLSGGIDPVTPPRHGQRVADALGAKARHVVVPNAGHGVMAIGCMRDVLFRFVDAPSDDAALAVDAGCVTSIPRPPMFAPSTR